MAKQLITCHRFLLGDCQLGQIRIIDAKLGQYLDLITFHRIGILIADLMIKPQQMQDAVNDQVRHMRIECFILFFCFF